MLSRLNYTTCRINKDGKDLIKLEVCCPMCGGSQDIELTETQYNQLEENELPIQVIMADNHAFDRETLISGMCYKCQSKLFNRPMPGESWGNPLGECERCGAPVYEKDNGRCPQCGCKKLYVETEDGG